MDPKVAAAILILCWSSSTFGQPAKNSPAQSLKNHAFAACISAGLKEGDAAKAAAAAAREYFEQGSLPIEAYTNAVSLADKFLSRDYVNIYGDNLVFMKCIDFMNSKELAKVVSTYSNRK